MTSLILHGKKLPWTVFISSWDLGDVASQKRDGIKFALWKVSSLKLSNPLYVASNGCPTAEQVPKRKGSSLLSQPLGDLHLVGPALPLGSHIPHAFSCTRVVTHLILFSQVTIFRLAEEAWLPLPPSPLAVHS